MTTQHTHIHDAQGKHVGDICGGTGRYYVARSCSQGNQKYDVISRHRSYSAAVMAMAKEFAKGKCKRADVLLCADYYDPAQLCELVRR